MSFQSILSALLFWRKKAIAPAKARYKEVLLKPITQTAHGRNNFRGTGYRAHMCNMGVGDKVSYFVVSKEDFVLMRFAIVNAMSAMYGTGNYTSQRNVATLHITVTRTA
jgi:hypothetical protein